jgi:hypothetical protein
MACGVDIYRWIDTWPAILAACMSLLYALLFPHIRDPPLSRSLIWTKIGLRLLREAGMIAISPGMSTRHVSSSLSASARVGPVGSREFIENKIISGRTESTNHDASAERSGPEIGRLLDRLRGRW